MSGLPYGAGKWLETQPVILPDLPAGHTRTVFPVGLVMPSGIFPLRRHGQGRNRRFGASLQAVKDQAARYHDKNAFLERLLRTGDEDMDVCVRFLSERCMQLHERVLSMEEQARAAQTDADQRLRVREDKHKVITADLEKKFAGKVLFKIYSAGAGQIQPEKGMINFEKSKVKIRKYVIFQIQPEKRW